VVLLGSLELPFLVKDYEKRNIKFNNLKKTKKI